MQYHQVSKNRVYIRSDIRILIAVVGTFASIGCPQYGRAGIELLWIQLHVGSYPVIFGVFYHFLSHT